MTPRLHATVERRARAPMLGIIQDNSLFQMCASRGRFPVERTSFPRASDARPGADLDLARAGRRMNTAPPVRAPADPGSIDIKPPQAHQRCKTVADYLPSAVTTRRLEYTAFQFRDCMALDHAKYRAKGKLQG